MPKIKARAYLSPTLVLLSFDWPAALGRSDFLGFAIKRRPGFGNDAESWLPNRIGFYGPDPLGRGFDSCEAPIQKFMWWDAGIDAEGTQRDFHYTVYPIVGSAEVPERLEADRVTLAVHLPRHEENGIGTWFNRAVVSSQAFEKLKRQLGVIAGRAPTDAQELALRKWLANGMEGVIPKFLNESHANEGIAGAIYHLTDELWVVPALKARAQPTHIVYDNHEVSVKNRQTGQYEKKPSQNEKYVDEIRKANVLVNFDGRNKTKIMHNKVLVAHPNDGAKAVLCGSANFTTGGLTSQANVLHTFASPELASYYRERIELLKTNPTTAKTAEHSGWSYTVSIGGAAVRAFFSPEQTGERQCIETIVQAIYAARSSVFFCLFMPTDARLRQACFDAGDAGKAMFGLVNNIAIPKEAEEVDNPLAADFVANVELYHRSKDKRDVVDHDWFRGDKIPSSFFGESELFPGEQRPAFPPVVIHHKFILIDGETDSPVVFTGSANMSKSSVNSNDENLLEIKGSRSVAAIYLAEFMRLYEHYRARAAWRQYLSKKYEGYNLAPDASWAKRHFQEGSPEWRNRLAMVAWTTN
jgi:phosphatidylserine/phosphatidylglycerophosphate/cardiolipin synthase-like enzyme